MIKSALQYLLLALIFSMPAFAADAPEKVRIQLQWHHQFQFAGYYAALEKGFYRDAGLEVSLIEGGPRTSSIDEVLQGRAQFGISGAGLVKAYLDGKPVLMLAPIFQHSPSILLTLGRSLGNPAEVARAGVISLQPGDENIDVKAMFVNEGIHLHDLDTRTDPLTLQDLLDGKIVAMIAYLSNEPFLLSKRGLEYTTIKPQSYGMDFYSDVLFTSQALAKARPETVAAFRAATLKGWQYTLAHQDELIGIILNKYNPQGKSREHLVFEAETLANLISSDLVEIGHSNPGRWRYIAETFVKFGLIKSEIDLTGFYYTPNPPPPDYSWLFWPLAISLIVVLVVSATLFYVNRLNMNLRQTKAIAEQVLADQRQFIAMVSHEFRAPLAVIYSSAQLLTLKLTNGDEVKPVVGRIQRGAKRLITFVENYLTHDRIENESIILHPGTVDLRQLVERAKEHADLLSTAHIVTIEFDPNLDTLEGDRELLDIVMANLLSNAI